MLDLNQRSQGYEPCEDNRAPPIRISNIGNSFDLRNTSPPAIFIDPAARALLLRVLSLPGIAARAVHPLLDIVAKEKGVAGLRPVREA